MVKNSAQTVAFQASMSVNLRHWRIALFGDTRFTCHEAEFPGIAEDIDWLVREIGTIFINDDESCENFGYSLNLYLFGPNTGGGWSTTFILEEEDLSPRFVLRAAWDISLNSRDFAVLSSSGCSYTLSDPNNPDPNGIRDFENHVIQSINDSLDAASDELEYGADFSLRIVEAASTMENCSQIRNWQRGSYCRID